MAGKTQQNYDNQRRAHTEHHDKNFTQPVDINGLPEGQGHPDAEDIDNIDFANYKGIYANDEHG